MAVEAQLTTSTSFFCTDTAVLAIVGGPDFQWTGFLNRLGMAPAGLAQASLSRGLAWARSSRFGREGSDAGMPVVGLPHPVAAGATGHHLVDHLGDDVLVSRGHAETGEGTDDHVVVEQSGVADLVESALGAITAPAPGYPLLP